MAERRGVPFLVAAPSGTGKTTVCRRVMERDEGLRFSISHTTRRPREGERPGDDVFVVIVDARDVERVVDDVDVAGDVCFILAHREHARETRRGVRPERRRRGTTRTPFSTRRRFGAVERL